MRAIRLWWVVAFLGARGQDDIELGEADLKLKKHLDAFGRRLEVVEHEPELLDEREKTPIIRFGDWHLRHVFTFNPEKPWLIGHAKFTDEYHEKRRRLRATEDGEADSVYIDSGSRRLSDAQTEMLKEAAGTTKMYYVTPRERVRFMAVLNGAMLPDESYTNASLNFEDAGGQIHGERSDDPFFKRMAFAKNFTNSLNLTDLNITELQAHTSEWPEVDYLMDADNYTVEMMGKNFDGNQEAVRNAYQDGKNSYTS
jgi:hypothetical protein